ncbi:MAG: hypothetical protein FIA82_04200, partial [Melioribacter sp.]|nr:hypothetical protein [Melioribacter sp.]
GEEFLSEKEKLSEYVMLAFRSKGLDLIELKNFFGFSWYEKNRNLFEQLQKEKFLTEKNSFISFTPRGYAICDEILTKLSY